MDPIQISQHLDASYSVNEFGETVSGLDAGDSAASRGAPQDLVDCLSSVGRYRIDSVLGKGGFGAVYKGYDDQLDRPVAIKVPLLNNTGPHAQEEFLREARQLAKLAHAGIVSVHDVGVDQGRCYIVTEFLEGHDLNRWLHDNSPNWTTSARIVAKLADALTHAHALSTVHRDVKPANIIMVNRPEGQQPVLVDFGLALSDISSQQRGLISGTPNYMSPEQARGEGHRLDGRTDIYALGVILYRMLCGRLPFRSGKVSDVLYKVIHDDPQPPRQLVPSLPVKLEQICLRALSKNVGDRQSTATDFARELRGLLEQDTVVVGVSGVDAKLVELSSTAALDTGESVEETTSPTRRAREAERRRVTMLACGNEFFESEDFVELDPEDQLELQSMFRRACGDAVSEFGGIIVEFTSQGMLACFGFPVAYEDAGHRAVRSGRQLLEAVETLRAEGKCDIIPQLAVHTGSVVAEQSTDTASSETLSVVGADKNVTIRMAELAEPGSLLISSATHELVRGFFECEGTGPQKIRGVSKPVEVFRVTGESAVRHRLDLLDPKDMTPLVGRDTELSILRDRWEQAAEGMGQVVLLIGEAGLGKSRLIREIREHVAQTDSDAALVELRCSSYHQSSGLHPTREFFENLLDLRREMAPAQKLDVLITHLQEYEMASAETVPLFATLLSIPLDNRYPELGVRPQKVKELTQQALLEWLRQFASRQPVLFIVEDLHWVDPSTLELLGLLLEERLHERILSIFTFRPDFKTPWSSAAHQTQVALNRLTKRQVGQMMREQIGIRNLAEELIAQIVERTDGVPLFVEEFTRVVRESEDLHDVDGSVQLSSSFQLESIPASLHDLLISRLDRMDSLHDVVQMGATLGREFRYDVMCAVSDLDKERLQEELDKLVQSEILFQKGRPPEASFIFKHALIQDAAYDSLLKKKRQQYHGQIAEVLESQFPEFVESEPELLAHHFTHADQREKAIGYWLKAGERSQVYSANTEAISHLTRGLEILQTLDESTERDQWELGLQTTLGPVLMAARGWAAPEVGIAIERAQQLVAKIGTVADQFFVMWGLWGWRVIRADIDICDGIAEDIIRLVEASPEGQELLSEAWWVPGCTAYYKGEFRTALQHLEKGLAMFDAERARANSLRTGQNCGVMFRNHIALTLWELGFPDQALRQAEEMVRFAKELEHPFSMAMALHFRRRLLQCCGCDDQARESVEEEYNLCHEQGFIFFEVHAVLARGDFLVRQGQFDAAHQLFELGLQMLLATGGKLSMDHPYGRIAEAYLLAGRLDDANEWINRGIALVQDHNHRSMESEFLRLQGERALSAGNEVDAEACFQQAAQVAERQHAKSRVLRAMISLTRLRRIQGRQQEGRQILSDVHNSFDEGFGTTDLVEAKTLLDELSA